MQKPIFMDRTIGLQFCYTEHWANFVCTLTFIESWILMQGHTCMALPLALTKNLTLLNFVKIWYFMHIISYSFDFNVHS